MIPTYGVFSVDPGLSTGLAWGRVRDEGTIAERLEPLPGDWGGSDTIKSGDWVGQARELADRWAAFRGECHRAGLPAYFVCEDFILTRFKSSDRSGLMPVWVAAATLGYRNGMADAYERASFGPAAPVEVVWQQPGEASGYSTDARLKRWGLWIPGREHERSAWRHFAFFVANEKSQKLRLSRARMRIRT